MFSFKGISKLNTLYLINENIINTFLFFLISNVKHGNISKEYGIKKAQPLMIALQI